MRRPVLAICLVCSLAAAPLIWLAATLQRPAHRSLAAAVSTEATPLHAKVAEGEPPATTGKAPQPSEPPAEPRTVPSVPWGSNATPISTVASFVYAKNHPATPLPALAFAAMTSGE